MHARLPLRHDLTDLEEAIVVEGVDFAVRGHRGRSSAGQRRPHGGRAAEGKSRSQHGEHFYRAGCTSDGQDALEIALYSNFLQFSH